MTSPLYALHIGTLATWLSVAGFGSVAVIVPGRPAAGAIAPQEAASQQAPQEITLGAESAPAAADLLPELTAAGPAAALPAPPAMPDLTAHEPLPEVPQPLVAASAPVAPPPAGHRPNTRAAGRIPAGHPDDGRPAAAGAATGGGRSNTARLAAGEMPPPAYPAEARRLGQTGTLVVDFTVDASGQVISAIAKSPSPWPLLNQEAIRTVRRWRFPPGAVMQLRRPITFQLR